MGEKVDIIKWVRRDKGDVNYWNPMQRELAISLAEWDMNLANQVSVSDVDSLVGSFNAHVNTALSKSLTIKKKRGRNKYNLGGIQKYFV